MILHHNNRSIHYFTNGYTIIANILFGEAFQVSCQSIRAIDIALRIGEELADQSGSILSLRKEHPSCLNDSLGFLDAEVLVILIIDALDSMRYWWQMA
jgi:hypothetical protein